MSRKYDRKYNYVYLIENKINGKTYIGVHKTDNLDDHYMGSGTALRHAVVAYGVDNFEKTIITFCETYREALELERELVNIDYVKNPNTYNLTLGGNHWEGSDNLFERLSNAQKLRFKDHSARAKVSEVMTKLWKDPEYVSKMRDSVYNNADRNQKIGVGVSAWIDNNPELHKIRMDKINKNPEKIRKMADAHRGMKRTDEAKRNVSDALKKLYAENPDRKDQIVGTGMRYMYNPNTKEILRVSPDSRLPDGWIEGSGPKDKTNYRGLNVGSFFAYDPETLKIKRLQRNDELPEGWIKGRPLKRGNG